MGGTPLKLVLSLAVGGEKLSAGDVGWILTSCLPPADSWESESTWEVSVSAAERTGVTCVRLFE